MVRDGLKKDGLQDADYFAPLSKKDIQDSFEDVDVYSKRVH
jgi:hypothetical protein